MIAPKDFSLPGGELTPTMKLKRHTVMEMYEKKIQQVIVVINALAKKDSLRSWVKSHDLFTDVRAWNAELNVVTSLGICDSKENNGSLSQPISTIQSRHEKETIELLSTDEVSERVSCPYQIDLGKESYSSQLPFFDDSFKNMV